jgi:hypothetical protein
VNEFGFQGFIVVPLLMVAAIMVLTFGLKYQQNPRKRKNDDDDDRWRWGMM